MNKEHRKFSTSSIFLLRKCRTITDFEYLCKQYSFNFCTSVQIYINYLYIMLFLQKNNGLNFKKIADLLYLNIF